MTPTTLGKQKVMAPKAFDLLAEDLEEIDQSLRKKSPLTMKGNVSVPKSPILKQTCLEFEGSIGLSQKENQEELKELVLDSK